VTAAKAETYLRLRAEAELRRALALPRYDADESDDTPRTLRFAARLARPATSLLASAARPVLPLAGRARGALQPLASDAAQVMRPLEERALRALRPMEARAARVLRPIAGEARRLRPLAGRASRTVREVGLVTTDTARHWRWRASTAVSALRHRTDVPDEDEELSAEQGVHRLRRLARALATAGAIDQAIADSIVAELETALLARSRIYHGEFASRAWHARQQLRTAKPPAGPFLAVPVGVAVTAEPGTDQRSAFLLSLVIAPGQAKLTALGRWQPPPRPSARIFRAPWSAQLGFDSATATDDRGNSYDIESGAWGSDSDGNWTATMDFRPAPPAGTRWLELTMSPGSAAIHVDLAGRPGDGPPAADPGLDEKPVARLFDAVAEDLLYDGGMHGRGGHELSDVAELVTALEISGALADARPAVDRLVALARRVGTDVPAALAAAARPAGLPEMWASVLENRHREDGPDGVAAATAVLPEIDGTRVVLAGLRSTARHAELRVLAWGEHADEQLPDDDRDNTLSWSARDDTGRWHVARFGSGSSGDGEADVELQLVPPLHPAATSLEVTLAGRSGSATVTVPLDWQEPP
jgi:hypothetical protein